MIIFTSLVFVAVLITSYRYFANLEKRDGGQLPDTGLDEGTEPDGNATVGTEVNGGDRPLWQFELNGGAASAPTVLRHDSASLFVLVQDAYHILHAISPAGEKLWNAQLGGAILDSIQQLPDMTLVFATAERLYRIDTEGDPLPGFSLRLPQPATQGAIASADNGGRVRIDVPTKKGMLSVDGRGSRLGNAARRSVKPSTGESLQPEDTTNHRHTDLPSDCGPHTYLGTLNGDGQVYLLCGKGNGTLSCYLWDR